MVKIITSLNINTRPTNTIPSWISYTLCLYICKLMIRHWKQYISWKQWSMMLWISATWLTCMNHSNKQLHWCRLVQILQAKGWCSLWVSDQFIMIGLDGMDPVEEGNINCLYMIVNDKYALTYLLNCKLIGGKS